MFACPKCGQDNDLGRIFCAGCGEKLDISKVSAPSGVRKRRKSGKPFLKTAVGAVVKTIKLAVLAAICSILALLYSTPPVDKKELSYDDLESFMEKKENLDEVLSADEETKITFTEEELNAMFAQSMYLASKNKTAKASAMTPTVESFYVSFHNKTLSVTIQNKLQWFRFCLQVVAHIDQKDDRWTFRRDKVLIGRFPLPKFLQDKLKDRLDEPWKALTVERAILEKTAAAEIKPGEFILTTKKSS